MSFLIANESKMYRTFYKQIQKPHRNCSCRREQHTKTAKQPKHLLGESQNKCQKSIALSSFGYENWIVAENS